MSKTQYLQRLGQSWYVRIKVPAALRDRVQNTHIRRALGTRDLDEAVRRKWAALAQIRAHLDTLAGNKLTPIAVSAIAVNCKSQGPGSDPTRLQLIAQAGVRPATSLDALVAKWLETSQLKTVRFQRQQAYGELRAFLDGDQMPEAVSRALAAAYVEERLARSPDSPSTRRRKLSALAAFWEWMCEYRYLTRGENPWRGFRLSKHDRERNTPKKRAYTSAELVELFSGSPRYPALREVMALGLFTGARIDELCSLRQEDVRIEGGFAYIQIARSKTDAGVRTLAVAHSIPFHVLRARHRQSSPASSQLFPELKGGGYDKKLSWHVGQAFRYHRNKQGLTGETDFHSLRRTFITRVENLGVDQVRIARYVGHQLPTLAFTLYSGGSDETTQKKTGEAINYPPEVEAAVSRFLAG